MCSGPLLKKLSQATIGSSAGYGKNRKMSVHLSVLRPDWNRADDVSTLVIILSARDPLMHVIGYVSITF